VTKTIKLFGIVLGTVAVCVTLAARAETMSPQDQKAVIEANKFIERGNEFKRKDSLARAKVEYERALKIFPRHLDAFYNLAIVCVDLKQPDEAIAHCKHYLDLKDDHPDVWNQLGVLLDEKGDKAGALAAYEKAVAIAPKFGRAHHNLGVLLEEQGKLDEARQRLELFVKLEEEAGRHTGEAYYSLGVLELEQLHLTEAKKLLQKALDTDPGAAFYNNALGDVYLAEKTPSVARVYYQKAIERDPKSAVAYSGLGDAQRDLGDRDQALAAYRKALELRPDYGLVHYKLGLLFETTNPADAIKHFESYLHSGKTLQYREQVAAKLEKLKQGSKSAN
jgi:tetratricopeptide (TPR) repeat protein